MAFASVLGSALTADSGVNKTAHVITMPSGIQPGEFLLCAFTADTNPTVSTTSTGWTVLAQALNGTIVRGAILYKQQAAGTSADDLTVDISISERATAITLRISAVGSSLAPVQANANGSSTNSNPPNLDTGTSRDYLWIVTRHGDSTVVATAAPTNFTNLLTQAGNGTSSASTNTAERQFAAQALDPGTFTSGNEQWVSFTVAIPPALPGATSDDVLVRLGSLTVTTGSGLVTANFTATGGAAAIVGGMMMPYYRQIVQGED
jgi:hypothetical protein